MLAISILLTLSFPVALKLNVLAISLPVLVLLPFPDNNSRNESGWDRGLELLPAARVAVKEINNRSDLLPGYEIELIEAPCDACGLSTTQKGLENFVRYSISGTVTKKAIAVIGLVCTTVTANVSPIAGNPEVDLLQISMSTSPVFRNTDKFNRLWRIIPPSTAFVDAVFSLLHRFNSSRISLVYSLKREHYYATTNYLKEIINKMETIQLVLHHPIEENDTEIDSLLIFLQKKTVRIVYVIATVSESARLLCRVANMNMIWPGYLWIFQGRGALEIIQFGACSMNLMTKALESVMFLNFQLDGRSPDDLLVSGKTYSQYRSDYLDEVNSMKKEPFFQQFIMEGHRFADNNKYSNSMYDEVWALALALNTSLPELEYHNFSLKDYQYNMTNITNIIEKHLQNVSFPGAVGDISFNYNHESQVSVYIFQVKNSTEVLIGKYLVKNEALTLYDYSLINFPKDDFDVHYNLLSLWIAIIMYTVIGICFVFTTMTLILMLVQRKKPEVKATSPLLSTLIFVGAYFLCMSSTFIVTQLSFYLNTGYAYEGLCYTNLSFANYGINIILATILMKLVRVYRVFTHFGKTSKALRDYYMVLYIVLIGVLFPCAIFAIFNIVVPFRYKEHVEYLYNIDPPYSYKLITRSCEVGMYFYIWCIVAFMYFFVLLVLIVFFSIRTRKIDKRNFKDTKKTISFVFIAAVVMGTFLSISITFLAFEDPKTAHHISIIMMAINTLTISFSAIVLLISPKVFAPVLTKCMFLNIKSKYDLRHFLCETTRWILKCIGLS